ncbi:MAG: ABC-2 family transporter protein [bacterium]
MRQRDVRLKSYWQVWLRLTQLQFQQQIGNARGAALLFIFGKLFRLGTAFLMVFLIVGRAKLIAGYNLPQAIFILALFNLTSSVTQLFMRGIYVFRQKIVDGTFDFYLLNPLSELFYSLFSYTDPMDLLLFIPYLGIAIWAGIGTGFTFTLPIIISILITFILVEIMIIAWHIIMMGVGIRYLEVDNIIMLYRDLEKMAAFPINMYGKWGSIFLTYVMPFALMATIPANILFGLFNPWYLLVFAALAFAQLKFALHFWYQSLLVYSSASS